jgi:hypothetical protein
VRTLARKSFVSPQASPAAYTFVSAALAAAQAPLFSSSQARRRALRA